MNATRLAVALLLASCSADGEVWRLGRHDGLGREFRHYHAWEYGSEKWVATSPEMDTATRTWCHRIPGRGFYGKLPFPGWICSWSAAQWMPDEEVVSGLRLTWDEPAPTNRLLLIDCASFSNMNGHGQRGIELLLGDGRKKVFNLPAGHASNKKDCFTMEAVVPVSAGENAVTIRIVTLAKHYRIGFDSISLHETDRQADFAPVLEAATDAYSGIAHPGDATCLVLRLFNAAEGPCRYSVMDIGSNVVARGEIQVRGGTGRCALPTDRKGWFRVEADCLGAKAATSYAVVEPPEDAFIDDSRFGCHAIAGDGYRLLSTRLKRERLELKGRRAFLGGAKWARLHYLSWACREPEKGRYVWDGLDRALELAERNRLRVLMDVVEIPQWNSPTNDSRLTVCGAKRFKMHPPVDASAWARFVETLVSRYRGRVSDFEIGNEPGFTSAFWMTGDPADFAAYLKTAYEAAHRANPDCRIYPGAPLDTVFHEAVIKANGGKPCYDVMSCHYLGNQARFASKTAGWKALNADLDLPPEIVNTEDMGWARARKQGEIAFAGQMAKLHVRDAVRGVKRTFAFQVFDDLSGAYSFFDSSDAPLPAFAVYRSMTHRLEHASYVGDLSTAEYEAYVFDRRGTPVTVCWNALRAPFAARLPLGHGMMTLVDAMDNETRREVGADGLLAAPLGTLPCYVEGGDWAAIRKAIAERPKDFLAGRGGNALGKNMAQQRWPEGRLFRGRHFVSVAKDVPVRYGETYVLAAKIRGKGELNGIYYVRDKDGKELFPCRQGLNCLYHRIATDDWTTVSETIPIAQEDAARLALTLVPNFYADKAGALEVRDVVVARISETYSVSKALHQGTFGGSAYGNQIAIAGASARVRMDGETLHVAFEVEDDEYDPPTDASCAYQKDSIQFAIDPANDGTDYTCFALGCLKDGGGFLFKEHNYTTPELPDNLTRHGLVKDARVAFERTAKGWRIEAAVPVREIYPLKAGQDSFGFNFLVNDCDGGKRTWTEWTEGIGGRKSAAPFGHLVRADADAFCRPKP